MRPTVRFVFVLHDHQPVGNFEGVFEQAYRRSYRPLLDLVEAHAGIRLALHTSGPLAEWLDRHHPDYLDRLARLVAAGRLEIVGGAFQEPILAMLPSRDRIAQIRRYTDWLQARLSARVAGMWVAERVWDPGMVRDLVAAGMTWTILDDFHFKAAGLADDQLDRYWLTEGDGATLSVFPVSEHLRYVIPFAAPEATIDHLSFLAARRDGALAVFGDDGEKFGVWPDTHRTVFEERWLERLFGLLEANRDWIRMSLPSEVVRDVPPAGTVWIPECSYREMTTWVLPPERQQALARVRAACEADPRLSEAMPFLRGGTWRNFRLRYPEANELYARMMAVSDRLEAMRRAEPIIDGDELATATECLHRGQCNCGYWHGAFGGIYLPHLRNALYRELIAADLALDRATGRQGAWVDATVDDFDFDGRTEIRLSNDAFDAWIAPSRGGILYELDLKEQRHNLLATLDRRPEAYHAQVLAGPGGARSVVDASQTATFKQEGLERMVRYDAFRRKSLVDHFIDLETPAEAVWNAAALERGDFAACPFEATVRRNPGRIQVLLSRAGNAWGVPFTLSKAITLEAGSKAISIAYRLEGLPTAFRTHLAVEFNFAGMPGGAEGRFFRDASGAMLGDLSSRLDLADVRAIGLVDDWLDIDVTLAFSRPAGLWAFPVESVSQSEAGFERVHQSVAVLPHWLVEPDAQGTWQVEMRLALESHRDGRQIPFESRAAAFAS
jgi:alpha-amylase